MPRLNRSCIAAALMLLTALLTGTAPNSAAASGPALEGYDLLTYFEPGGPQQGSQSFAQSYKGDTYWFVSAANAAAFANDPQRYVPEYGGYCALGMAFGSKSPVDPLAYSMHNGRLYFLINPATLAMWQKKRELNIERADQVWQSKFAEENH